MCARARVCVLQLRTWSFSRRTKKKNVEEAAAPERRLSANQALGHAWLKSGKKQLLAAEQHEARVQQAAAAALPVDASAAVAQIDLSDAS